MPKYTPKSTSSGYNLQNINQNFLDIADFINNNLLCRDNPVGEPNQMLNDLDMNGHDLLNVDRLDVHSFSVDGQDPLANLQHYVDEAQEAATESENSAVAAAGSALSAAGSLTQVQSLFLGAFASDPATAPEGALYYNSTVLELRYRRSGVWVPFPQANAVNRQFFVAGTDFTAGATTVLPLPATSYTKNVLWVYFDGSYVQPNRYTLTDQTHLTFTAPITSGTTRVEVGYITPLGATVVDDNSLTTAKYQDQSVTTAKIADSAITAVKLSTADVDNINLKLGVALAVDSVATMKALPSAKLNQYTWIDVAGYYGGTTGGGRYLVTSDTTTTTNEGTVIAHTATGRRFFLDQIGAPTIEQFGARMDGVTDDALPLQRMTGIAGLPFTIPTGRTMVVGSATTIPTQITFRPGASILANVGINLVAKPNAPANQLIFRGTGPYNLLGGSPQWDEAPVDWFYGGDLGPAIPIAWRFSNVAVLNARNYTWATSATVPAQSQGLVLKGKGYRATSALVSASIIALNYTRVAGQSATSLHVQDLNLQEVGAARTATAIKFYGNQTGGVGTETTFYDDNWMRVERCSFVGFLRATDTMYATQCYFTDNYYQANAVCHFMMRDSSFFYMSREMALDNTFASGSYIFQQDATNDGRSNGLSVTDCRSVLSLGIDVQLQNYQLASFVNTTLDLGQGGAAAFYINSCQDIRFANGWIASSLSAKAAGRVGVFYQASRHSSFTNNTFNSCAVGFEGNGGSSISVTENSFDNCGSFDITDIGNAVGYTVTGNKHKNTLTSSTISLGGGSSRSNVVMNNIMVQASYAIPAGTNSINSPNIFSTTFPI